jgi:hypothetical protein
MVGNFGYNSTSPAIDHYRNQGLLNSQLPQPTGQNGYGQYSGGGFGYNEMSAGYMPQQQEQVGRRGRVSLFISS